MEQVEIHYRDQLVLEVLSGGLLISAIPQPIQKMAPYLVQAYPVVEERTGIRIGLYQIGGHLLDRLRDSRD